MNIKDIKVGQLVETTIGIGTVGKVGAYVSVTLVFGTRAMRPKDILRVVKDN